MKQRAQSLLPTIENSRSVHGGGTREGKRKTARPLATKRPLHLVFKSRRSSMHRYARAIQLLLQALAKRHHVRCYEYSNNNNHLHLLVRGKTRHGIQSFLRVFAGQVAQLVGGAVKGKASGDSFWLAPVYSRIVDWKADFYQVVLYIRQNRLEAAGLIPYQPRSNRAPTSGGRPGRKSQGRASPARTY